MRVLFTSTFLKKNWELAIKYYQRAVELMQIAGNEIDIANLELNLQIALHRSGKGADIQKVRTLSHILESNGDPRAAKADEILGNSKG